VREAIKRGVKVVSIPGATAPIAALTSSGLPTDKFFFVGYLPKKNGKRLQLLNKLKIIKDEVGTTLIFFESPHRLDESLQSISESFGDVEIVIARELTKIHEEVIRSKVSELKNKFKSNQPKGEFVILI
jgi:16S rRNA (cytidine1402-2'-O)-methyltransferase